MENRAESSKQRLQETLYFTKTNLSHLDFVLNVPGSTQTLPTVETTPSVENIKSDLEV